MIEILYEYTVYEEAFKGNNEMVVGLERNLSPELLLAYFKFNTITESPNTRYVKNRLSLSICH